MTTRPSSIEAPATDKIVGQAACEKGQRDPDEDDGDGDDRQPDLQEPHPPAIATARAKTPRGVCSSAAGVVAATAGWPSPLSRLPASRLPFSGLADRSMAKAVRILRHADTPRSYSGGVSHARHRPQRHVAGRFPASRKPLGA